MKINKFYTIWNRASFCAALVRNVNNIPLNIYEYQEKNKGGGI